MRVLDGHGWSLSPGFSRVSRDPVFLESSVASLRCHHAMMLDLTLRPTAEALALKLYAGVARQP